MTEGGQANPVFFLQKSFHSFGDGSSREAGQYVRVTDEGVTADARGRPWGPWGGTCPTPGQNNGDFIPWHALSAYSRDTASCAQRVAWQLPHATAMGRIEPWRCTRLTRPQGLPGGHPSTSGWLVSRRLLTECPAESPAAMPWVASIFDILGLLLEYKARPL